MLDAVDDHQTLGVVDLIDDAVNAASSGAQAGELTLWLSTETMWVVEQCAEHELDDCRRGAFGETAELSFGGAGDAQRVGRFLRVHLVR